MMSPFKESAHVVHEHRNDFRALVFQKKQRIVELERAQVLDHLPIHGSYRPLES